MKLYSWCLAITFVLGSLLLSTVPASADCPEPAPDPTGWWEWVETLHYDTSTYSRPGVGLSQPTQYHYADGERTVYVNESMTFTYPYFVDCFVYDPVNGFSTWVTYVFDINENTTISVGGAPGERTLTLTYQAVDGYHSVFTERNPIQPVATEALTWQAVKGMYR